MQEEIEKLRNGSSYRGDIRPFVRPSRAAIEELATELRQNPSENVRTEIVKILLNVGIETSPHRSLSDPWILSALFYDAGLVRDTACLLAFEKLALFGAPDALVHFGPTIAALLEEATEPSLLLIVAKAKAMEAMPSLQKLSDDPSWNAREEFRIALAALGDEAEEEFFTKPFASTQDPKEKTELATRLGRIGTSSAMKILASEMRSPLVQVVPNSYEQSVRTEFAKALHFRHPECTFLEHIETDADYERIERFCELEYGVVWTRPRPAFLTMRSLAG